MLSEQAVSTAWEPKLSAEPPEMGLIMSKVVLKIGCLGLIHQYFVGIGDRDC
jgi:hypothetical protein